MRAQRSASWGREQVEKQKDMEGQMRGNSTDFLLFQHLKDAVPKKKKKKRCCSIVVFFFFFFFFFFFLAALGLHCGAQAPCFSVRAFL